MDTDRTVWLCGAYDASDSKRVLVTGSTCRDTDESKTSTSSVEW